MIRRKNESFKALTSHFKYVENADVNVQVYLNFNVFLKYLNFDINALKHAFFSRKSDVEAMLCVFWEYEMLLQIRKQDNGIEEIRSFSKGLE